LIREKINRYIFLTKILDIKKLKPIKLKL